MKTKWLWLGLVSIGHLLLNSTSYALDNSWTNTASEYWDDTFNWSTGLAPSTDFGTIWVTNVTTKTVTVDGYTATRKPATLIISNLTVSGFAGVTNTLFLNSVGFVTPLSVLGILDIQTNGALVANNSAVQVSGNLFVGRFGHDCVMSITNGGQVFNSYGYIGNGGFPIVLSNSNAVQVCGSGAMWSNRNDLAIGFQNTKGNSLIVTNGGAVYSATGAVGGSSNAVVITGAGSIWNNSSDLNLADPTSRGTFLTIANGGAVYDDNVNFGGSVTVLVTGAASVWSNHDSMNFGVSMYGTAISVTISNGGAMYSSNSIVGGEGGDTVLVTGTGSIWSNQDDLTIGEGDNDSLLIFNGGAVYSGGAHLGFSGLQNQALITGTGSVWTVGNNLDVDYFSSFLNISNGGAVYAGSVTLGSTASISISGGTLYVGTLSQGTSSLFVFNTGTLASGGTSVANNQPFLVGDGTNAATFLLNGGIHSFADTLGIRSNSFLTGCGTINGNVLVDAGGTVLANCGGTMTFSGIVTNNGTMQAINGSMFESSGTLVNNGTINGTLNLRGLIIDHGTVLSASNVVISTLTTVGNNVTVLAPSLSNCTYQLQASPALPTTNWSNIGSSRPGTGGVLSFADLGGATNRPSRFYRIHIIAP